MLPVDPASREVVYSEPGSVPKALGEVDVVFPVLHGPYGEDGTLQGLLELSGVPYVGAGVLASAVGQDKEYMKRVFTSFGLHGRPVRGDPPARVGAATEPAARKQDRGLRRRARLAAVREARPRGLVDRHHQGRRPRAASTRRSPRPGGTTRRSSWRPLLRGREIECGVLEFEDGPRASRARRDPAGHRARLLRLRGQVHRLGRRASCPRRSPRSRPPRSGGSRSTAFEAASCEGLVRADFFLTEDGEFVINEINTMPGFTPISMYPRMWQESGVELPGAGGPADPGGAAPLHRPALTAAGRSAVRRRGPTHGRRPARSSRRSRCPPGPSS